MEFPRSDHSWLFEQFSLPRFPSREEANDFRAQSDARKFAMRRFFLFFGSLAFLAHSALDMSAGGDTTTAMLFLRTGCVTVMFFLAGLFAKRDPAWKPDTLILSFLLAPALTIILMTILVEAGTAADTYPFGLVILLAYGGTVLSPPSMKFVALCTVVYLLYLMSIPFSAISPGALVVNLFFVTVGLSAICIGSLSTERLERSQFSSQQSMVELNQDLEISRKEALIARDEAIEASQTQAKFIASTSHELRTPLNAILGFSEYMLNEFGGPVSPPSYKTYVEDIHRSGQSLLLNINDLLDVHRLSSGKMSWTDTRFSIDEMVRHALSVCSHEAREGVVTILNHEVENSPDAFGDMTRMTQVITNLLTNAVKFTDPGGTVTVEQGLLAASGEYCITISDNGIGIAAEDLERIKTPFQQAEDGTLAKRKGGLGLGLAIVGGILDQIDGRFELDSELDYGTTCRVFIPRHKLFLDDAIVSVA